MSSENDNHAVLVEALEAGGYNPAAVSAARVASSRGLGQRTTTELVAAADPAAGKIAQAIFGTSETTPQVSEAEVKRHWEADLRSAVGIDPNPAGGE